MQTLKQQIVQLLQNNKALFKKPDSECEVYMEAYTELVHLVDRNEDDFEWVFDPVAAGKIDYTLELLNDDSHPDC